MVSAGIGSLSNSDALESIAQLINVSGDLNKPAGTARAF
jgi:hypothetical protein